MSTDKGHSYIHRALAALLCGLVVLAAAPASAMPGWRNPSRSQLARLAHFDKYVEYFTSLAYGPENARISPTYIRSLIVAESSADPRARSHKGARGLTQIMLETGRIAGRAIRASGVDYDYVDEQRLTQLSSEDLYDPAINILIACYLSATYLERFGGRTDLVVSAWNAGPEAVTRYGNRPPPYTETRQLLVRVHGYMGFFGKGEPAGWRQAAWDAPLTTGSGWHRVAHLPSRDFVIAARRAAQRASVPSERKIDRADDRITQN